MKSNWDDHLECFTPEPFKEQFLDPSRIFVAQIASGSTLECGCASAIDVYHFTKLGKGYKGIDITEAFIKQALNRGADVRFGSIVSIPFKDKSFGTVYCRHVLEHLSLEESEIAIREMIRVARNIVAITFFIHPTETEIEQVDALGFYTNTLSRPKVINALGQLGIVSEISFASDKSVTYMADSRLKSSELPN